jgi:hypothetical protein
MNQDPDPQLPLWIEALQHLRPDQIRVLTYLAERGEPIDQMLEEAIGGFIEHYRQEHGLPQDWPFEEQDGEPEDQEP